MAKRGKDSKVALAIHGMVHRGALKAIDAAKLFKLHKKQDKFALNYLRRYVSRRTHLKVSGKVKQGKAKVKIKRMGYSFLISGRDLLPVVSSDTLNIRWINQIARERFFREKYLDFSSRSWDVIPEYIGPRIIADKRIKRLLALSLFAPELKINIIDESDTSKRLISYADMISDNKARTAKKSLKSYDLNVKVGGAKLGKFKGVTETSVKAVHIREGDMDFIERYIGDATGFEVQVPDDLTESLHRPELLALAKASARMEMRTSLNEGDIERIKQLNL